MKPTRKPNDVRIAVIGLAVAVAAAACGVLLPSVAAAQMYEQSWNFKSRDRAGLAVVMKQAESGMYGRSSSSGAVLGSSGAAQTYLVCGGAGGAGDTASSATANSSCIILNNTTGDLSVGQDAQGDQTADAQTQSTVDQVQNILDGEAGGQQQALP